MDGEKIRQFGGSGFFAGKLNTPSGISIDAKGSIIMGDAGNDRVQV